MFARVKPQRRIAILDRSVLAGNLYRLLFSSLEATPLVRRKFEDMKGAFARRERVDLAIFNSNAFGKKFDEIIEMVGNDGSIAKTRKIFILKEGDSEKEWEERIKGIEGAKVITRPFHPDDFLALVRNMVEGNG